MPHSVSRSQRSSSSVGSASSAFLDKLEAEASGADILDNSSALQAGIFGVLFTVTKEKYNTGWRFLTLKLVLDYLQLFTLTFTDTEPWVFDDKNILWKVAQTVNIDQVVAPLGYNFFIGLLYIMVGLLMLMMGLSLWVAWCFKNRSFPSVWPIKVLRVYAYLFFQILDVLTLSLFQVPFNCRYIGYDPKEVDYMANYPDVKCSAFPHVVHMVTSGCALLVFVVFALLNLGADFELSPLEKGLLTVANGQVEVQAFVVKFAMTFVSYAIGWEKVRLVLLLVLAAALTYLYLRWSPHLVSWVNHLRVGLYTSVLLSAVLAVVLVHGPAGPPEALEAHRRRITTLLWALIGPAALLGAAASYCRLNVWSAYVLKRFREGPPGEKARRIYKFGDPREVEIVSRVCRKWVDQHREILDKRAVKEGEIIIKAGLQLFPGRCYMLILYSNYLIDVLDNSQTGYSQMAAAKQAGPDWMQRFAIFAREQEQLQRLSSARGGESGVDLVSYVEYQKNHRLVIRAHKDALIATRTFWQVLLHNHVRFTALAAALNEIERTVLKAESAYKMVLSRYPTNAKLARTYGRFLENVVNNPWKAAKYYVLAERLTEMQEADEAAGAEMAASGGGGGGEAAVENRLLHRVDERVNAVFIINANGIIQMANKNACSLLGYGKGELDGKNINVIMPPPFSQRHNKYVRQYAHTGRETVLNTVVSLPALHKDRYVIPVRVGVTKVSGAADSSTFMGVLEPIAQERNEANVYLLPGGTVAAVDRAFVDWFAKELDDCIAQHLADLTADEASAIAIRDAVERIAAASKAAAAAATGGATANPRASASVFDAAAAAAAAARAAAAAASHEPPPIILLRHKYARPVRVSVRLQHVGVGSEVLLCATLTRTDPPDSLVLVDGRGRIGFITSELAEALGATPEGLARQPIADLLPQPWNALHANGGGGWLREAEASMGGLGSEIQGDHQTHPPPGLEGVLGMHHLMHASGFGGGGDSSSAAPSQHHRVSQLQVMQASGSTSGGGGGGGRPGGGRASGGGGRGGGGNGTGSNGAGGYGSVTTAPPGSCLAGATVVLGSSSKVQDYYRVEVSRRGETVTGQPMRVVMVRKSSLAAALSERRLAVVVDAATGTVLEAGDSPASLFGFKPAALVGRNIADVVSALRPPTVSPSSSANSSSSAVAAAAAAAAGAAAVASRNSRSQAMEQSTREGCGGAATGDGNVDGGGGPAADGGAQPAGAAGVGVGVGVDCATPPLAPTSSLGPMTTTQLLCQLAVASMAVGGTSWRVGVTPPMDERNLEVLGLLRGAFISRQTRPAVMEVDVLVPGGEADDPGFQRHESAPIVEPGGAVSLAAAAAAAVAETNGGGGGLASSPGVADANRTATKSMLYGPTFKEMHERGLLSVEAAATIEAGLTALTGGGGGGRSWGPAQAWPAGDMASKAATLRLRVNLWRAEVLGGVLEVDGQGEVVNVAHAKLHQTGLLFGLNTNQLPRMRLSRLLNMPVGDTTGAESQGSVTAALFNPPAGGAGGSSASGAGGAGGAASQTAGKGAGGAGVGGAAAVRTALKSNRKPQKVGPLQLLLGHHADGAPLELAVQAVVKEGSAMSGRTLVFVKLRNPYKAPDQASLLRALEAVAPKRLLRARGRRAVTAAAAGGATAAAAANLPLLPSTPPSDLAPLPATAATASVAARAAAAAAADGGGVSATGGLAEWTEWNELVAGLEAGGAVGTGMGNGDASAAAAAATGSVDAAAASLAATAAARSLRGPAVLVCDGEELDGSAARRGVGSDGGAQPGNAVQRTGSPQTRVGGGAIGSAPPLSELVGSKDSDDLMLAGIVKYDAGGGTAVGAAVATDAAAAAAAGGSPFGAASGTATADAAAAAGTPFSSSAAATGLDEDDEYDESDDADGDGDGRGGSVTGRSRAQESGDGECRSVDSASSSSSSSRSGGDIRRGNSSNLRVNVDSGPAATGSTGPSASGVARRRKGRQGSEVAPSASGTRRVILNTPSMKKVDSGGGGGGGGGSGGGGGGGSGGYNGGGRPPSPLPTWSSRRAGRPSAMLDNQPSLQFSGSGGGGVAAVTTAGKGGGGGGGGGTAPLGRRTSVRHVDSAMQPHPESSKVGGGGGDDGGNGGSGGGGGDAQGGLFGELQTALLAVDAGVAASDHTRSSITLGGMAASGVAAGAPGAPDDPDEVGSQGSAVSGMDEEVGGAAHQADYRRGKRFKKLAAMLGSPLVQRAARDFRWQALLANVAQVVSNLISFVLLTLLLHTQIKSVGRLTYTANGLLLAHELFIDLVLLDNLHRGLIPNTSWYDSNSLAKFSSSVEASLVRFEQHHSSSYLDSGTARITDAVPYNPSDLIHNWNYPAWPVIDYYSVDPPRVDMVNKSLWELGTSIWVQALDVHHMQTSLAAAKLRNRTAFLDAPLRNLSAPTNNDPFTDIIVARHLAGAYTRDTTDNSSSSSNGSSSSNISWVTGIWTVPGEDGHGGGGGSGSSSSTAVVNWTVPLLNPGLSWSDAWRFVLSAGPTQLYQGYHHTLLALTDRAVTASNNINRVQLVLMLVEGCAVATLLVTYMWWLQHRVTQQRYRVYGVFMAVPVGMIRALASRTITISQGSDSEEDSDDDEYQQQQQQQLSAATQVITRQFSAANSSSSFQSAGGFLGFLSQWRVLSRRNSSSLNPGGAGRTSRASRKLHRRRMIRNSRDSLKLLIPFVVWGVAICIIYATGYYYLQQVQAPVNLLSVIDSAIISVHRLMLYSLLTCSELAAHARVMLRELLASELRTFKLQWDVMLYGANGTTSSVDRRFGRIQEGVSFIADDLARILYRAESCRVFDTEGWCPNISSPFYAATEHGLSYMVERLVEDVEGLLAESLEFADINSTRLAYIMTVGQGPLQDAFHVVHAETVTIVDNYYKVVDKLHIAAMVLSWVLVVCFLFCMLRPFLHRNRGETNRIAKMLSQLPAEVDIEGLVFRLLLGAPAMRRRNRRASVSSLVAEDPVLAAKMAQAEAQAEKLEEAGFPQPLHRSSMFSSSKSRVDMSADAAYGSGADGVSGGGADGGGGMYGMMDHGRRGSALGLYSPPPMSPSKYGSGGGGGGGHGFGGEGRTVSGLSTVDSGGGGSASGGGGGGGGQRRTLGSMGRSLKGPSLTSDTLGTSNGDGDGSGGGGGGYQQGRKVKGRAAWM